jgi:hypothetical protein
MVASCISSIPYITLELISAIVNNNCLQTTPSALSEITGIRYAIGYNIHAHKNMYRIICNIFCHDLPIFLSLSHVVIT